MLSSHKIIEYVDDAIGATRSLNITLRLFFIGSGRRSKPGANRRCVTLRRRPLYRYPMLNYLANATAVSVLFPPIPSFLVEGQTSSHARGTEDFLTSEEHGSNGNLLRRGLTEKV